MVDNDEDFDVKDLDAASGVWYAFDKKSNGKYELTAVKSDDQKTGTPSKDDTSPPMARPLWTTVPAL